MSAGLALSQTISPVKPITSVPFHIFTKISVVPRGHIYVHLWIDNAHVFSACTVSPGAPTGPHSDIPMFPLAHRCERCDWSTDLVRCLLLFVDTRFKVWPNVTNKITSTSLNIFSLKLRIEKLTICRKTHGRFSGSLIPKPFPQTKKKITRWV